VVRVVALAVVLAGCDYITNSFITNEFSGDPYPIYPDTTSGAIVVGALPDGDTAHTAVLDVMSPITIQDHGATFAPAITHPAIDLLGERGPGGALDLPRARFPDPQLVALHPCQTDTCSVGTPADPVDISMVIGMDTLGGDALRLHLTDDGTPDTMFILPDIAGDETHRALACDADFPSPFHGGGTLVIGGTELAFTNWRIAIDACFAPDPDPDLIQSARGADMLLVLSSGLGVSLLGESAYGRYQLVVPSAPPIDSLPDDTVVLPSGPVTGKRVTIATLALVANSPNNQRAPCRQVYASHVLAFADSPLDAASTDCACGINSDNTTQCNPFCGVPAIVELAPSAGVDFLIVPDNDPNLQALRAELRPDEPEVDGILGTAALRGLELDIDYPDARLLGRCVDNAICVARPEIIDETERAQVSTCLPQPPGGPITALTPRGS